MRHLSLYCLPLLLLIGTQFSCFAGSERVVSKEEAPQFIVTDSLVVDHLGTLSVIEINPDRSEYLMYHYQMAHIYLTVTLHKGLKWHLFD